MEYHKPSTIQQAVHQLLHSEDTITRRAPMKFKISVYIQDELRTMRRTGKLHLMVAKTSTPMSVLNNIIDHGWVFESALTQRWIVEGVVGVFNREKQKFDDYSFRDKFDFSVFDNTKAVEGKTVKSEEDQEGDLVDLGKVTEVTK